MFNKKKNVKTLKELTGAPGGVLELSQECVFVDWSETDGNPNMITFNMKVHGDGKSINATPIPTPSKHVKFIQNLEEERGFKKSTIGFKSWKIDSETIVTINEYWA